MELLSRLLKIFLSLPRTTSGVRSLEVAESSPKPLENDGVVVGGVFRRGGVGVWNPT